MNFFINHLELLRNVNITDGYSYPMAFHFIVFQKRFILNRAAG